MLFPWLPTTLICFCTCVTQSEGACWFDMEPKTQGRMSDVSGLVSFKDFSECQDFCTSQLECVAAEFRSDTNECYIYDGPTTLQLNIYSLFMQKKCTPDTTTKRPDDVTMSTETIRQTQTTELLTVSTSTDPSSPSTLTPSTTLFSVTAATSLFTVQSSHRDMTTTIIVHTSTEASRNTGIPPTTVPFRHSGAIPPTTAPSRQTVPSPHSSAIPPATAPSRPAVPSRHSSAIPQTTVPSRPAVPSRHSSAIPQTTVPSRQAVPSRHSNAIPQTTVPSRPAVPSRHSSAIPPTAVRSRHSGSIRPSPYINHNFRYGFLPFYEVWTYSQSFRKEVTQCLPLIPNSIFRPVSSTDEEKGRPYRLVTNLEMHALLCWCFRESYSVIFVNCPWNPNVINLNLLKLSPPTRLPTTTDIAYNPEHRSQKRKKKGGRRRKTDTCLKVHVKRKSQLTDTRVCLHREQMPRPPNVVVVSFLESGQVFTDNKVAVEYPYRIRTNLTSTKALPLPPPLLLFTGKGSKSQLSKLFRRHIRQLNKSMNKTTANFNNVTFLFTKAIARHLKESIRISKVDVKFRKKGFTYVLRGRLPFTHQTKKASFTTDT